MSTVQISFQGYGTPSAARWPDSTGKRTSLRAARIARLRELAFDPAVGGAFGKRS